MTATLVLTMVLAGAHGVGTAAHFAPVAGQVAAYGSPLVPGGTVHYGRPMTGTVYYAGPAAGTTVWRAPVAGPVVTEYRAFAAPAFVYRPPTVAYRAPVWDVTAGGVVTRRWLTYDAPLPGETMVWSPSAAVICEPLDAGVFPRPAPADPGYPADRAPVDAGFSPQGSPTYREPARTDYRQGGPDWYERRGGSQTDRDPEPAAIVMMAADRFEPRRIRVQAGETVEWRNTSDRTHTVTADPERARDRSNVVLPAGADPFHSGSLRPGERFIYTFRVPGRYRYVCLPHEGMGMIGEVEVRPAD